MPAATAASVLAGALVRLVEGKSDAAIRR